MWICAELLVTKSLTVVKILEGSLVEQKCTGAFFITAGPCICQCLPGCNPQDYVWLQEEVAREEAHNASQEARLKEQEARVKEKQKEIEAKQASLNRQMQEVDRKGRELDSLNRKYEKAVAAVPVGEDAGEPDQALDELHHVTFSTVLGPCRGLLCHTPSTCGCKILFYLLKGGA